MIFEAATSPTPLIAPRPKRMQSPSVEKRMSEEFTSGGSTLIPISLQVLIMKAIRSADSSTRSKLCGFWYALPIT